jgi:hypothetical protein
MKPILAAALALALAPRAPPAAAQTTLAPMTVEAVNVRLGAIDVTGVSQGATTAHTATFAPQYTTDPALKAAALDRCHRSLLLALAKPGQYVARVSQESCSVALVAP